MVDRLFHFTLKVGQVSSYLAGDHSCIFTLHMEQVSFLAYRWNKLHVYRTVGQVSCLAFHKLSISFFLILQFFYLTGETAAFYLTQWTIKTSSISISHTFPHSLTHSFIHSLTHSFTDSLTHSITDSLTLRRRQQKTLNMSLQSLTLLP